VDAVSSAPAPSGAERPWLAITLAAIAVIGPIAVAYVPVVSEARKARAAARNDPTPPAAPPPPPVSPPPPPTGEAYELMESAIADTRAQRDAALARADRLQHELNESNVRLADLREKYARLDARGRRDR